MRRCIWKPHVVAALMLLCGLASGAAEMEVPDAALAADADYCVIVTGSGDGMAVRRLVFGNPGWQRLRVDSARKLAVGQREVVFLTQDFDGIRLRAFRAIDDGRVAAVNVADWPQGYSGLNLSTAARESVPIELNEYARAVQQIAARARGARTEQATAVLRSILTMPNSQSVDEYQRLNEAASNILRDLHADDTPTLALMTQVITNRSEPMFSRVRGMFATQIASKYFRAGFDAVRTEAFRNTRNYNSEFAEGEALGALSRVGNASDLRRMRSQLEASIARGGYSHLRGSLFSALGQLVVRLYPAGSGARDEWLRWLERFCTNPTAHEEDAGCPWMAARALGIAGTAESKAVLQSLMRPDQPDRNGTYAWAIRDIDARLSRAQ